MNTLIAHVKARLTSTVPMPDAPAGWIVMNAPRPLIGQMTLDNGPFLTGRFYAAVDPADPRAADYIKTNINLDCRVVISVTRPVLIEMALGLTRYAEEYRASYSDDQLFTMLPLHRLADKTVSELTKMMDSATTKLAPPAPAPAAVPARGEPGYYDTPAFRQDQDDAVAKAFEAVAVFAPEVAKVLFDEDARWDFQDAAGNSVEFPTNAERPFADYVGILEDAADIVDFPSTYLRAQ